MKQTLRNLDAEHALGRTFGREYDPADLRVQFLLYDHGDGTCYWDDVPASALLDLGDFRASGAIRVSVRYRGASIAFRAQEVGG